MPVGVMLRSMSSMELTEWMAFARIEPFGALVDDYRAGLYPSMKANSAMEGKPKIGPLDLFPWNAEPEPAEKPDPSAQIIELFEQAAREEKLRG